VVAFFVTKHIAEVEFGILFLFLISYFNIFSHSINCQWLKTVIFNKNEQFTLLKKYRIIFVRLDRCEGVIAEM
jgi:hypothetical protein